MPDAARAMAILADWPELSREAAQLVVDRYGEPHEATPSELRWFDVGPWKRIMAQRAYWEHNFPVPHHDSVESVIDYRVPIEKAGDVLAFDGSVVIERTTGELSARCHDEQANSLALNLTHEIVAGIRTANEARDYYAIEFLGARRGDPTPYMNDLRFEPAHAYAGDPDERVLSDQQIEEAKSVGAGAG